MSYTDWSVIFGEQPTAAKWNQLGANDAGFKDGTNIDDHAVLARHIEEQEAWHEIGAVGEPAFENSWVNYSPAGSGYNQAAFMKDSLGFVHLKGFIKTGASASVAFTLPAGYRPLKINWFPSQGNDIIGKAVIAPEGTVKPYGTGVSTWFTLDGIVFKGEA